MLIPNIAAEVGSLNPVKPDRVSIMRALDEKLQQDHDQSSFEIIGRGVGKKMPEIPRKTEVGVHIWHSSSSTTWMRGNHATDHYISEAYAVDTPFGPDSGSRINRILISDIVYPKRRARYGDRDRRMHHPPILATPGDYHEMSHIDLKSCYYNIIRVLGIYPEIDWERRRFGVWDRLDDWYPYADNKKVRNAMYGMVFQPQLLHVNSKGWKEIRPDDDKKVCNPGLHHLVMIIVNDIGRFAEKLGSPYWHTDGGLLPQIRAQTFYDYVGETWGLPIKSTISEGEASVYGAGRWWYEDHECKGSQKPKAARQFEEEFEGIEWLKDKISYWVLVRGKPEVIYKEVAKTKEDEQKQQWERRFGAGSALDTGDGVQGADEPADDPETKDQRDFQAGNFGMDQGSGPGRERGIPSYRAAHGPFWRC